MIHALPVAEALGRSYPNLELTWLVEEMSADIVAGCPYLADVIVVPRMRWKRGRYTSPDVWQEFVRFLAALRRRRFDVTLDLQGYAKSGLYAFATGAPHRFGWNGLEEGAQLVSRVIGDATASDHRVDQFLAVAGALGADISNPGFPLYLPPEAIKTARTLLAGEGLPPGTAFAALNPAAGSAIKRWGALRYAELARELLLRRGIDSVLIGSCNDVAVNEQVRRAFFTLAPDLGERAPRNLAGRTGLKELLALISECAVHVSGDTGSLHVAAALGRPLVALFGPTDPTIFGPYGRSESVLAHRELCTHRCTDRTCALRSNGRMRTGGCADVRDTLDGMDAEAHCLRAISAKAAAEKVEQVMSHERYER
jgi:lipopolysaccharide heptosyltransferase II